MPLSWDGAHGFVVISEALPRAFVTSCSGLHWVGTLHCTNSHIRLDDSDCASHVAVGNTTRNGDLPMTGAALTLSGMVMLLRPRPTVTCLSDGKDTQTKGRGILS